MTETAKSPGIKVCVRTHRHIVNWLVMFAIAAFINILVGWSFILLWQFATHTRDVFLFEEAKMWIDEHLDPQLSVTRNSARVERSSALGFVHTIGYGVLEDNVDTIRVLIEETAVGVPFASLSGQYSRVGQKEESKGLLILSWSWPNGPGDSVLPAVLPYNVFSVGFAANCVCVSGILYISVCGRRRIIRWSRYNKGLCPQCRYQRMDLVSHRCPECGWRRDSRGTKTQSG